MARTIKAAELAQIELNDEEVWELLAEFNALSSSVQLQINEGQLTTEEFLGHERRLGEILSTMGEVLKKTESLLE